MNSKCDSLMINIYNLYPLNVNLRALMILDNKEKTLKIYYLKSIL